MALKYWISFLLLAFVLAGSVGAQAKRNSRQNKTPEAAETPTPEPQPSGPKKNERPAKIGIPADTQARAAAREPLYRYEFSQPDFVVKYIVIEHDDSGKGTLTFEKRTFGEPVTEPIQISPPTMDRLKAAFNSLNFLDSTEDYQFENDFSHMGNVAITLKHSGRERTAKYNWTTNKDAKTLMDEYRRVSNQFVWMFDFNLARENQPLETPRLVASFDSLLKRNEIADPHQMLAYLRDVSNDERVPLIGRNHAGKLVKQIEKQKKD